MGGSVEIAVRGQETHRTTESNLIELWRTRANFDTRFRARGESPKIEEKILNKS